MSQMNLNIIINGFQNELCARILERALKTFQLGYCMYINQPGEDALHLPVQKKEVHHPDMKADALSVDWNTLRPLDEKLIEDMRDTEAVFLHMMTRFEKRRTIPYQERKRRYLQQIRYWNDVLEERKIHLFLSNNIPHQGYDFIIYSLCKIKNIPALFFYQDPAKDMLFLLEDWEDPVPGLRERFEALRRDHEESGGGPVKLSGKFEAVYTAQSVRGKGMIPWYMCVMSSTPSPWLQKKAILCLLLREPFGFVRQVYRSCAGRLSSQYWSRKLRKYCVKRKVRALFRYYDAHAQSPDLSRRFIYVPLHYQPECSTCPMAGAFVDQVLILQMLSSFLPEDVFLYVKEHPRQTINAERGRDIMFYHDLQRVRGVRFVPRNFDTFRLMEKCVAVATATGEAGWEALFRGKPVLMFGHRFYQYAPGVFPIHSAEDCEKALRAIFAEGSKPISLDVRLFMKALEGTCISGCIDSTYQQVTELEDEENVESVSRALMDKLRSTLRFECG